MRTGNMLKTCCFCFNLYYGSLLLLACRLLHWATLFLASVFVAVHIFSPDNTFMPYRTRMDIEQNSYILFLIMLVSMLGVGIETVMLLEAYKRKFLRLGLWYAVTGAAFVLSIVVAINFILSLLEIPARPETGKNFFQDAFCALFHVVYFFIPEYLLGPRLTPVLTACMIIVHLLLPLLHAYSFAVIRSFVNRERYFSAVNALSGGGGDAKGVGHLGVTAPTPQKCRNLCQKCALAQEENGIYRCNETDGMLQPFETTC